MSIAGDTQQQKQSFRAQVTGAKAQIAKALKQAFPETSFHLKLRYSRYEALLRIDWADGPEESEVDKLVPDVDNMEVETRQWGICPETGLWI
jgi:hypothetical protein